VLLVTIIIIIIVIIVIIVINITMSSRDCINHHQHQSPPASVKKGDVQP